MLTSSLQYFERSPWNRPKKINASCTKHVYVKFGCYRSSLSKGKINVLGMNIQYSFLLLLEQIKKMRIIIIDSAFFLTRWDFPGIYLLITSQEMHEGSRMFTRKWHCSVTSSVAKAVWCCQWCCCIINSKKLKLPYLLWYKTIDHIHIVSADSHTS